MPVDNRRDYGGDYARDTYYAPVRLMMDDPPADKSQALINYVQFGIDLANMVEQEATACQGASNPSCAGHGPGRALPLVFAATMLDSGQDLKDIVVDKQNKLQDNWMTFHANAPAQVARQRLPYRHAAINRWIKHYCAT